MIRNEANARIIQVWPLDRIRWLLHFGTDRHSLSHLSIKTHHFYRTEVKSDVFVGGRI